jgi:WhiB family transcriptional regulator, redox-sensing transcriptional regulator
VAIVVQIAPWNAQAACRGNWQPFFGPEDEAREQREARERCAKAICAACPVRAECQADIDARPTRHGIFAAENATDRENRRRRERRRLRQTA